MATGYVMDWAQAAAAGATVVGGKALNLGRLHRYGFRVPKGGVMTAGVYDALLADPLIRGLVAELEQVVPDQVSKPDVISKLDSIRDLIQGAALPTDTVNELQHYLANTGLDRAYLAIRSSATAEDSATASFAGIHESFLNVRGWDETLQAIKGCYASLWTPRALAYRRAAGLTDEQVRCAVVVCEMVGEAGALGAMPVSAGVAFSCDPRTGDRERVTISAVKGLGEALVSGSANPEELAISTAADSLYRIIERRSPGDPILTDDAAVELARHVTRVLWALGDGQDPQDIEWVYDGHEFWLVQARPVTRVPRNVPERAKSLPVIWSNGNVKDAVPIVLSTYGWSMMRQIINVNLYTPHRVSGYPVPSGIETIRRFEGRPYFDLTSMAWIYYDAVGLPSAELNRSLGGYQPEIPLPTDGPFSPDARRRNGARFRLLRAIRKADRQGPQVIREVYEQVERWSEQDLTALTDQELVLHLENVMKAAVAFAPHSMLANTSAGIWQQALEVLVERIARGRGIALAAALLSGSGNVVSAEHGFRLYDLARTARTDPVALGPLQHDPDFPQTWKQLPASSPFRKEFEAFLKEFGHRGVYEVDVLNPRWNDDPTYLIDQIRIILELGADQEDPRHTAQRRRVDAETEVASRTRLFRRPIRWLTRRAHRGYALREASKSALVAFLGPTRHILLEVADRMIAAGNLESADDVFFLSAVDVELFLRGLWDGNGARNLVADRKAQREAWLNESPPDVFLVGKDGEFRPWNGETVSAEGFGERTQPSREVRGDQLKGIAVSSGSMRGTARVLMHPNEGQRLGQGEILIAPSTDPGWTPLFLRAGAVVMEVGGYHSHGAIVSREYGLPAVANIPGLLEQVRDGDEVLVDGDQGTVTVLDAHAKHAIGGA